MHNMFAVAWVALMIAVIVCVDVLFFKNQFRERLPANIGIVLVFITVYFAFIKHR